jgi:hypothetical protein
LVRPSSSTYCGSNGAIAAKKATSKKIIAEARKSSLRINASNQDKQASGLVGL